MLPGAKSRNASRGRQLAGRVQICPLPAPLSLSCKPVRENGSKKPSKIGGCLRSNLVVSGDRIRTRAKSTESENYLSGRQSGHRQPGGAVTDRAVALDLEGTAGEILADRPSRKSSVPLMHRLR